MNKLSAVICGLMVSSFCYSKDFGVQGEAYTIVEKDIRATMMEQALDADWSAANSELNESAKSYSKRLPKRYLPISNKELVEWIDPSIELTSDIQAPIKQPDGTYEWGMLYEKGTKVNPLDTYSPVTTYLFFDGAEETQLKLVKELLKQEPLKFVPVEAGAGDLSEDFKALDRPVYYGNEVIISKFEIKYLPALVFAGGGSRKQYIGKLSPSIPFSSPAILNKWKELSYTK